MLKYKYFSQVRFVFSFSIDVFQKAEVLNYDETQYVSFFLLWYMILQDFSSLKFRKIFPLDFLLEVLQFSLYL